MEETLKPKGLELFTDGYIPADMQHVIDFQDLLEQHFRDEHRPEFYVGRLAVTKYRLNVLLRTYLNKTAYELIQERVHQEALKLLKHTILTVKEITFELGVCDSAYFCNCFKKITGMKPKEWRRQHSEV